MDRSYLDSVGLHKKVIRWKRREPISNAHRVSSEANGGTITYDP